MLTPLPVYLAAAGMACWPGEPGGARQPPEVGLSQGQARGVLRQGAERSLREVLMRACRLHLGRRGTAPGQRWTLFLQRLLQRGMPACRRRQARLTLKVHLGCLSSSMIRYILLEIHISSLAGRAGADAK